jgi:cbb3-type cytochrome oxidase subunit 3
MFKEVLNGMDVRWMSNIGLLMFVVVFIAICLWAITRKRAEVTRWNNLPLDDERSSERENNHG